MRLLDDAARILMAARHVTVFTGAGISVESGIPPFRGAEGIWNKYDPRCLDIAFFLANPLQAWEVIREIFYDYFGSAVPNDAHFALASLEHAGKVKTVITQNIDNLHQDAGSANVLEFHGNSRRLRCLLCDTELLVEALDLSILPPRCRCGGVLKPDFVFFGEPIPEPTKTLSFQEAKLCDVMLVIGSTGEVYPAAMLPSEARRRGAKIIEINPEHSEFTAGITHVFLQGMASALLRELLNLMELDLRPSGMGKS